MTAPIEHGRAADEVPRWTLGPEHPDYGFGRKDWRPMPPEPYRTVGRPAGASLNGRWSRKYDRCQDCGKTDRKYAGRSYGFCCYYKHLGEFAASRPVPHDGRDGATDAAGEEGEA